MKTILSLLFILPMFCITSLYGQIPNVVPPQRYQFVFVGEVINNELIDSVVLYKTANFTLAVPSRNVVITPVGMNYKYKAKAKVLKVIEGLYSKDTVSFFYHRPMVDDPEYTHYNHILCKLHSNDNSSWELLSIDFCSDVYMTKEGGWIVAPFSSSRYYPDVVSKYGKKVDLKEGEYIDKAFLEGEYAKYLKKPYCYLYWGIESIPPIEQYYTLQGNRAIPKYGIKVEDFMTVFPKINEVNHVHLE